MRTERLDALARAIRREGHHISRRPHLMRQQLHNWLAWELEEIRELAPAARPVARAGCAMWLRRLNRHPPGAFARVLTISSSERRAVEELAFAPNRRVLAVARGPGAELWDVEIGLRLARLPCSAPIAFSPDGRVLAGRSAGGVTLFDSTSGEEFGALPARSGRGPGPVSQFSFSPDGDLVVAARGSATLEVLDAGSLAPLARLEPDAGCVVALRWCDRLVVALFADETAGPGLLVWNPMTGETRGSLLDRSGVVTACAFSADCRRLALVTLNRSENALLELVDVATGRITDSLCETEGGRIVGCAFSPDGRLLVTANWDARSATCWEVETGEQLVSLGHDRSVRCCVFSRDGRLLSTGDGGGSVKIWDVPEMITRRRLEAPGEPGGPGELPGARGLICGCISHGRDRVAWGDERGTLRLTDLEFASRIRRVHHRGPGGWGGVTACAFTPGDDYVRFAGTKPWPEQYWNVRSEVSDRLLSRADISEEARLLEWGMEQAWGDRRLILALSRDAGSDLTHDEDAHEIRSRWRDGTVRLLEGLREAPTSCAFSPDGKWVAALVGEQPRIWNAETGEERPLHWAGVLAASVCAVALEGAGVVLGDRRGLLSRQNVGSMSDWVVWEGHEAAVNDCVFAPDGRIFASGSDDGTVKLWSWPDARELACLPGDGAMRFVNFDDRSEILLCGDAIGNVYVMRIEVA